MRFPNEGLPALGSHTVAPACERLERRVLVRFNPQANVIRADFAGVVLLAGAQKRDRRDVRARPKRRPGGPGP